MNKTGEADPNCSTCHGTGYFISDEKMIDGEYWCAWMDCHCIPQLVISRSLLATLRPGE